MTLDLSKVKDWRTAFELRLSNALRMAGYVESEVQEAVTLATPGQVTQRAFGPMTGGEYPVEFAPVDEIVDKSQHFALVLVKIGGRGCPHPAGWYRVTAATLDYCDIVGVDNMGYVGILKDAKKWVLATRYIEAGG